MPGTETAQSVGYGLDDGGIGVRFPAEDETFLHNVQTSSGAYTATYPISTGSSFSEGKAAGT